MDRRDFLRRTQVLRKEGKTIRAIAAELGVHPSSVQRALKSLADGRHIEGVFVARQQEMSMLTSALFDALSGRGRAVMVSGEPGIGKTRHLAGASPWWPPDAAPTRFGAAATKGRAHPLIGRGYR